MKGILGRKLGMTQVFSIDGKLVPVTVVQCEPNIVVQQKTLENEIKESHKKIRNKYFKMIQELYKMIQEPYIFTKNPFLHTFYF